MENFEGKRLPKIEISKLGMDSMASDRYEILEAKRVALRREIDMLAYEIIKSEMQNMGDSKVSKLAEQKYILELEYDENIKQMLFLEKAETSASLDFDNIQDIRNDLESPNNLRVN